MMGKLGWLGAIALVGLWVPATLGQPGYENDFNSLTGITTRAGVLPPYLYTDPITGDAGAVADTEAHHQGYSVMDIDFGLSGYSPLDFSAGEFQLSLLWNAQVGTPSGNVTLWIRLYSGYYEQDPNGNWGWVFSGGQNYAFEVIPNSGFNTFTRSVADYNSTDWLGPFLPTQVYKIRIDSVVWEPDPNASVYEYHPYTFGVGYFHKAPWVCRADYDCDGDIDFFDIDLLLAALGGEQAWTAKYQQKFGVAPPCDYLACDVNGDGSVDVFDIDAFLASLGQRCRW